MKNFILIVLGVCLGAGALFAFQPTKQVAVATSGALSYNCTLSAGTFENGSCTCQLEAGQTQADMYDTTTGFCQASAGGPAGNAFNASIGLPYGSYAYYTPIIVNLCTKSGGTTLGTPSCICPAKKTYSKITGQCT